MTEETRSRRPSSARPRRALRTGPHPDAAAAPQLADQAEPTLGDVSFDEWFETPVFESDPNERLEELATTRRGPLRLAASTFLRLNARASQVRRRVDATAGGVGADAPGTAGLAPRGRDRRDRLDAAQAPAQAPAPAPAPAPEARTAPVAPLRQRLGQALDRWAEREADIQVRLERLILPKRWQA